MEGKREGEIEEERDRDTDAGREGRSKGGKREEEEGGMEQGREEGGGRGRDHMNALSTSWGSVTNWKHCVLCWYQPGGSGWLQSLGWKTDGLYQV